LLHHRAAAGIVPREPAHVDRRHLHERDAQEQRHEPERQGQRPLEPREHQAGTAGETTTMVMSSFCAAAPRNWMTSAYARSSIAPGGSAPCCFQSCSSRSSPYSWLNESTASEMP